MVADTLVEASLRGVDSHGLALLPTYIERISSGQMRPGRGWIVRRDTAARAGVLLPVGGSLGYGLGLLVDVLTGGLAAGPTGQRVPGDRSEKCRARRLREGIPVASGQWDRLVRELAAAGVAQTRPEDGTPRLVALAGDRRNT